MSGFDIVRSPPLVLALTLVATLPLAGAARAATTVRLPTTACTTGALPELFGDSFEDAIPTSPSNGSGGAAPGDQSRTVVVPETQESRTYYLHLPPGYTATRPWPLVVVLHGAQGTGTGPTAAQQTRTQWITQADTRGFIVLAPAATGPSGGGWNPPADEYAIIAAIADAESAYNVERTRRYLWGFSAGGHYGHGFVLDTPDRFAAYSVSAGALLAYACTSSGSFACSTYLPAVTRKVPVDIHIGTTDSLYATVSGDPARLTAGGWDPGDIHYTEFPGGHLYSAGQLAEIWTSLCTYAVVP